MARRKVISRTTLKNLTAEQQAALLRSNKFPLMKPGKYVCECTREFEIPKGSKRTADPALAYLCGHCARAKAITRMHQERGAAIKERNEAAREHNEAIAAHEKEAERQAKEEAAAQVARAVRVELAEAKQEKTAEEMLLFREYYRKTNAILTPEEVEEVKRNCALIRAAPEGLTLMQTAERETVIRELCNRKLIYFVVRMRPDYEVDWFNIELAERLERFYYAIIRKESPRLILAAPPRHGKSMLVSEYGPAWFLGKMNQAQFRPEVISSSYNDDLATDFSKSVQNIIREPFYKILFDGLTLSDWSKGVDAWETSKHGKYRATGVGGSLTGRGAHLLNIEDPFKNRQEADSANRRKVVWDWYTSTAYTRLLPGAGVLVCATRWHDDDHTGRLLEQLKIAEAEFIKSGVWPADADRWDVVSYPAIAVEDEAHRKEGDALHPARYTLEALMRIRRTLTVDGDPRDWAALYQQTPIAEEGAYFTKEMLHFYDEDPPGLVLAGGDLALSKEQWADNSVMLFAVLDAEDNLCIFDGIRAKLDSAEIVDTIFDKQKQYKVVEFGFGKDVIEKSLGPFIDKRIMEERRYDVVVTTIPHQNLDKPTRARPAQGRMKMGKVKLKRGAKFLEWFLPEVLAFPNAKKDDVPDALATLVILANDRLYAPPPQASKPSWRDKLNHLGGGKKVNSAMAA